MVTEPPAVVGEDPRFARSRQAIADALADLVLRTDACPSVSTLAEAAGIHRATFYNHFDSVEHAAVHVITSDFRALRTLDFGDRQLGADPASVALATLNTMLETLRRRRSLFLLASTWQSPSGLMGIGDLLVDQIRDFRHEFGGDEQQSDADSAVEDIYTACGMNGVLSAALGDGLDGEPEEIARRLYAALPDWMQHPRESSS
ncbi:TetR/AcrR family transcriptional regulator [Promicromonospora sp. CA-289599]|uniref:TetR/AcrR family transcriptional regulator n=1 Tax=Promicromonospora sp. CA-289599 TaxID=3240014 RepID=UPI003D90FB29